MRFSSTITILSSITAATVQAVPTSLAPTTGIDLGRILASLLDIHTELVQLGVSVNNVNTNNIVGQANLNPVLTTTLGSLFTTLDTNLHNVQKRALDQSQGLRVQLNSSDTAQLIQTLNETLAVRYRDVLGQLNDKRADFGVLSAGDLGKTVSNLLNSLLNTVSSPLSGLLGGLGSNLLGGGTGSGGTLSAVNRIQQGLNLTLADHNALTGLLSTKIDPNQQDALKLVSNLIASLLQVSIRAYAG